MLPRYCHRPAAIRGKRRSPTPVRRPIQHLRPVLLATSISERALHRRRDVRTRRRAAAGRRPSARAVDRCEWCTPVSPPRRSRRLAPEFAARQRPIRPPVTVRAGLNHVGVRVDDLDAAIRFYAEGFGLERIPAPSFGSPVVWLRAGSLQLHLTETDRPQPSPGHFALEVDDFGAVYRWATSDRRALARGRRHRGVRAPGRRVPDVRPRPEPATSSRSATVTPARWREEIPELVRLADLYPQNADAGPGHALSRPVSAATRT